MEKLQDFQKEEQEVLSYVETPGATSTPSTAFKKELKASFLRKAGVTNFNILEVMKLSKKHLIAGLAVTVVTLGGLISYQLLWPKQEENVKNLSDIDLSAILAGAMENNNLSRSNGLQAASAGTLSAESTNTLDTGFMGYSISSYADFNYSHFTTTVKKGPAADSCPTYYSVAYPVDSFTTETYSYWDESHSASKTTEETSSGELISYYYASNNEYFSYFGGDYAIKETYIYGDDDMFVMSTEPAIVEEISVDSESVDSEAPDKPEEDVVSEDVISGFYGENVAAVDYVEIDGQYYVVVEYTWDENYCSFDFETYTKVVYRQWINEETFEVLKEEAYVDSVSPQNLIATTSTTQENATVEWETVSDKFDNDYKNVTVKEYVHDYSDENKEADISTFLDANNFSVLIANDYNQTDFVVYYSNDNSNYPDYSDRALYPDTELGEAVYEIHNNYYTAYVYEDWTYPLATSYFDESEEFTGKMIFVTTYDGSVTPSDAVKIANTNSYLIGGDPETMETVPAVGTKVFTIDGTSVTATAYLYEYEYSEDSGRETSLAPEAYPDSQIYYAFTYKNATHVIYGADYSVPTFDPSTFVFPSFTSYTTQTASGKAKILELALTDWYAYLGDTEPAYEIME